ncbi:Mor transcription activator family protein [Harryflintia acetispora]|uniref:Mor transcription activator family protein n=1 Tax=Harryflintia acetispora TaxID=1849041 RepID=UPI001899309E|nr:Mor transcription activator family protein [Harryflintia acetispora]
MLNVSDWIKELPIDQLPEPYQTIAYSIGVENTLKVADLLQGTGAYFPKLDSLLADIRNEKIRKEYNGFNTKELARKYDLSERWIYEIIRGETDEAQTRFF